MSTHSEHLATGKPKPEICPDCQMTDNERIEQLLDEGWGARHPENEYRQQAEQTLAVLITTATNQREREVLEALLEQEEAGILNERYGHWVPCRLLQDRIATLTPQAKGEKK